MANSSVQGAIDSLDEFENDSEPTVGQHKRWDAEIKAAFTACRQYQKQGAEVVQAYLNSKAGETFNLNLFHANIRTMQAMMFGKLPEIKFSRTNMDFNDDSARVAGILFERMLNADIGTPNDLYSEALKQNLQDRLLPGLGISRVRYEFDKEEVEIASVTDQLTGLELEPARTEEQITDERAPIDYVHWRDFVWAPARTWQEVRWVAFRTLMTKDQLTERFGEDIAKHIPLEKTALDDGEEDIDSDDPKQDAWMRGEVWEIWAKEDKKVYWFCKGYSKILDEQNDPLQLTGFFPIPQPMVANVTTTAFMPKSDYKMSEDLYLEITNLETRIAKITEAIKVVGVYDQSSEGVKSLMLEGVENDLIPVDNWAMFGEKGGLQGAIDWLPIKEVAETMMILVGRRDDAKALLFEISGMSDIMRGGKQAGGAASATERALEARFASINVQSMQDEFAQYATDLIRLRAEIVSKHFQPESIVKQSNAMAMTAEQELIQPAIDIMKNRADLIWRIEVKAESVAMVDYAQLKEERTSYITALATFLQSAAPLVELEPTATPVLLEMLKWGLAGFKGSNEVEGVLDQAIKTLQSAGQQGENDKPSDAEIKAQTEQAKQQFEMQKLQLTQQFEQQKWQYEQQHIQLEAQIRQQELQTENNNNIRKEQAQAELNMVEEEKETEEFIKREQARARLNPTQSSNE
ncbi:MAG: hypothetical protein CL475_03350 [Acidobacteria bacterium]|nr:hypothetical protein [Acidobacteriota bacterium]